MKKLVAVMLIFALVISLSGCFGDSKEEISSSDINIIEDSSYPPENPSFESSVPEATEVSKPNLEDETSSSEETSSESSSSSKPPKEEVSSSSKPQKEESSSSSVSSSSEVSSSSTVSSSSETSSSSVVSSSSEVASSSSQIASSSSVPPVVSSSSTVDVVAPKPTTSEMRGVWISYLEFDVMLKGKSEAQAKANIDTYFNKAKEYGLNTVIVQVRPFADAIYNSSYFPWSKYVTGTQGVNPGYDPLAYMVQSAHSKGLEIHAWINPYRVLGKDDLSQLSNDHIARKWLSEGNDAAIRIAGQGIYFNPARQQAMDLIANGVAEIVSNYNIDAIHFDDYFYPTTESSFDIVAYNEYKASGGAKSQADWRRDNVSRLMKQVYSTIKGINSSVEFGISPQGNNQTNYNGQYADIAKWVSNTGYLDYICPQMYYGFDNKTCPYSQTFADWNRMVTAPGIKLYTGLAVYKCGVEDTWAGNGRYEWLNSTDILKRQVQYSRTLSNYGGFVLYRFDSLFSPSSSVANHIAAERANLKQILN